MKTNLRLIGGQKLKSPNNSYTRPTTLRVREAIFNILNKRVENSNWLDNLLACQFHPEKSGKTGEKLLRRWLSNIQ